MKDESYALWRLQRTLIRAALLILSLLVHLPAQADEGRLTGVEENDSIAADSDRHYTQGIRLAYLSGAIAESSGWNRPYSWLSESLGFFDPNAHQKTRKISWILGQSLFTPRDLTRANPDAADRPYAGWLYTGASLLQESALAAGTGRTLENFEILVGVVGPAALGKQTQNDFHQIIGAAQAQGWAFQLRNEPALVVSYERKWRFARGLADGLAVDIVPELGVSVGNVLSYAAAGATLRIGRNIDVDYGQARIRPSLSGTDWFNGDAIGRRDFGWYVFVGTEGRLVGRNLFLDGSSFAGSRSVDKRPAVADIDGGLSLFWSRAIKIDLSVTRRTKEFTGQIKRDNFAMASLSLGL